MANRSLINTSNYKKFPNGNFPPQRVLFSFIKEIDSAHLPGNNSSYVKKWFCFDYHLPWHELPDRVISPNIEENKLCHNKISTSKYTWLTFIPLNLLEQFSKLPNLYFLVNVKI